MSNKSATVSISLLPLSVNLIKPKPSTGDGHVLSRLVTPITEPAGSVIGVTNLDNTCPSPVDGFGLIRFTDNGNREMDTVADLFDIVLGLDGSVGKWDYNFSMQFSNQLVRELH